MADLNDYTASTTDWRANIRRNTFRTYVIIGIFVLIYLAIGLMIDLSIYANTYPKVPLETLFQALITFKLSPTITMVMLVVAGISLLVSYAFYDRLMLMGTEYREITPTTAQTAAEKQFYNIIEEMKIAAGLSYMPKVYLIEADYMNAFASGYSEKSAMVAITRGLLEKLDRDEIQAVMAHELSHIRHMDIKVTLTASLLANLSLMVLDIFFYQLVFGNSRGNKERSPITTIIILLRYLLPVINILLLLYLSRKRELMADAGAVQLTRTNTPLATALMKIQGDHEENRDKYKQQYQQTPHENVRREAYFFDPVQAGFEPVVSMSDLFSTHPSLQERLDALGYKKRN